MSSDSDSDYDSALDEPAQCRICYGITGEEVLDDQVCLCTGNLRYICLSCLRREVARETQNIHRTSMPYCSTCHGAFTSIRYEIGPNGQFQNVQYVSLRGVRTFRQFLAAVSDRDYMIDGFIAVWIPFILVILVMFNWYSPWMFDNSLPFRIFMIVLFIVGILVWILSSVLVMIELRSHYRDYQEIKRKKKRK